MPDRDHCRPLSILSPHAAQLPTKKKRENLKSRRSRWRQRQTIRLRQEKRWGDRCTRLQPGLTFDQSSSSFLNMSPADPDASARKRPSPSGCNVEIWRKLSDLIIQGGGERTKKASTRSFGHTWHGAISNVNLVQCVESW